MQTIKVILAESGRVANLKKDFPLYVGSYQNKLLNVLVPKSILAPNFTSHYIDTDGVVKSVDGAYTAVKIGMTYLERTGVIKQSTTFFMRYLKDVTINNVEYSMYERLLPKEFTLFEGQGENAPKLIVNIVNVLVETKIDDKNIESIGTTLEVVTSQYASIDVMYSAELNNEPEYNPSDMELLSAIVNAHTIDVETSLKNSSDALETSKNADKKSTDALSKAEDALNSVISGKGTSVYVGGKIQSQLNFSTDPQSQINNNASNISKLQENSVNSVEFETLNQEVKGLSNNVNLIETNKADKTMLSNPNLLINGDFRIRTANNSPDMWIIGGSSAAQLDEVGITITTSGTASFIQVIKVPFELFSGKVLTLSAKMNGKIYFANATIQNEKPTATTGETAYINFNIAENNINGWLKFVWHNVDKNYRAYFYFSSAQTVKFDYVKLEIGAVATTYVPNFTESYLIKNIPSNPNLLINGDFGVNQRGKTSYTGSSSSVKYLVDRWAFYYSNGFSYDVATKTITATSSGSIVQYIENSQELLGKTLTLSCKVNGVIYSKTATLNSSYTANTYVIDSIMGNTGFKLQLYWHNALSIFRVMIATNSAPASITIDYVKLELGSIATPFTPRPYAEELALCQRYFQKYAIHNDAVFGLGLAFGTEVIQIPIPTLAELRKSPTIKLSPTMKIYDGAFFSYNISSYEVRSFIQNQIVIRCTTAGLIQDKIYSLRGGGGTTADYIEFDAEIY